MTTPFTPNTELCVDIKTILASDPIAKAGIEYYGKLLRDSGEHFTFKEVLPFDDDDDSLTKTRRKPASCNRNRKSASRERNRKTVRRTCTGAYISSIVTLSDGGLQLNFHHLRPCNYAELVGIACRIWWELVANVRCYCKTNRSAKSYCKTNRSAGSYLKSVFSNSYQKPQRQKLF